MRWDNGEDHIRVRLDYFCLNLFKINLSYFHISIKSSSLHVNYSSRISYLG